METKHIDTKYNFISTNKQRNNRQFVDCRIEDQIADIFAKPLIVEMFKKFRLRLNMTI